MKDDIAQQLRDHVYKRAPDRRQIVNPAWQMMLKAADEIEGWRKAAMGWCVASCLLLGIFVTFAFLAFVK